MSKKIYYYYFNDTGGDTKYLLIKQDPNTGLVTIEHPTTKKRLEVSPSELVLVDA